MAVYRVPVIRSVIVVTAAAAILGAWHVRRHVAPARPFHQPVVHRRAEAPRQPPVAPDQLPRILHPAPPTPGLKAVLDHRAAVVAVRFSPDGRWLGTVTVD